MVVLSASSQRGFTLVEMGVVLAIIGLIAGGVVAGQYMIGRAQLNAASSDLGKFKTAYDRFYVQYQAIPGDMLDATEHWGTDPNGCPTNTVRSTRKETCNGAGDGYIAYSSGFGSTVNWNETFRAWQHLANAGYLDTLLSGVAGSGGSTHVVTGENAPVTAVASVAAALVGYGTLNGTAGGLAQMFPGNYGNALLYGVAVNDLPYQGFTTPRNAFAVDSKIDDGNPANGTLRIRYGNNTNCVTTTVASTAAYNVSEKGNVCSFVYIVDRNF